MRLKLSINRKIGTENYGSRGAGAEVELNLGDDETTLENVAAMALTWYQTLEASVTAELARQAQQHTPPPARQAEPEPARRSEPPARGHIADERPFRARNDGGEWRGFRPPRTPSEFLAWAKKRDVNLNELSRALRLPGRVLSWSDSDVQTAYDEVMTAENDRNSNGRY